MMFAIAFYGAKAPRNATVGIVGLIAYMVGLVTRQHPETLPIRLVVLLLAAGSAALVCEVLLPQRPQAEAERLRHAVRLALDKVLRRVEAAIAAGGWTDRGRDGLHVAVRRLCEVIMMAQARLAADQGARWLHLLAIELATERVARVALHDLGPPADRPALLSHVRAMLAQADSPPREPEGALANALGLLEHALREAQNALPLPAAAPPPPTASAPGIRPALQTAIAAALAITSGELVSPNRWYWAAFTAYVMFQGTRSRSESVAKGLRFMIGTLAGVVAGALLGTLLSGHELITMAAIVLAVFLAFQANVAAYGVMVFWITIILGLVFSLVGYFAPEMLLLRLEETAAGAGCGVLVASFVLVRRDRTATHDATIAFLQALGRSVSCASRALLDHQTQPELTADILAAEQRFRDLDAIARSEQSGHPLTRDVALNRRILLLEACEQWARELGQISLQRTYLMDPALEHTAREAAARISDSLAKLIEAPGDDTAISPPIEEAVPALGQSDDDPTQRAVRLLLRIDAALRQMSQR